MQCTCIRTDDGRPLGLTIGAQVGDVPSVKTSRHSLPSLRHHGNAMAPRENMATCRQGGEVTMGRFEILGAKSSGVSAS